MRGKLVSENIRFDRTGDPRKGMDVGLRGDKDTPRIIGISFFNPRDRAEELFTSEEGEEFLHQLIKGQIPAPHLYSLIGKRGRKYNVFQYPPKGLLNTPFLYHNDIYTIPEEILYESVKFKRGEDPKSSMNIGVREAINKWMDWVFPSFKPRYQINEDLSIRILGDFDAPDAWITLFPPFINFEYCTGDFHIDHCNMESLRGCPKRVDGFFSCEGNRLTSLDGMPEEIYGDIFVRDNPGKFKTKDVYDHVKVIGKDSKIYSQDQRVDENKTQTMRAKYVYEAVGFQRMGPDAGKKAVAGAMGIGHEGAKFDFGKYKGQSAYQVYEEDPQYILWLAGGGMKPRNAKQENLFKIIKQLEKQYYEDIEKEGWEYYGQPGDKFEGVVTVDFVKYVSGDYGAAYSMSTNDGKHKFRFYFNYNKAEKLAPADPDSYRNDSVTEFMRDLVGKEIKIKGKVKYHKEYKGYPWTNMNYVNILEIL